MESFAELTGYNVSEMTVDNLSKMVGYNITELAFTVEESTNCFYGSLFLFFTFVMILFTVEMCLVHHTTNVIFHGTIYSPCCPHGNKPCDECVSEDENQTRITDYYDRVDDTVSTLPMN